MLNSKWLLFPTILLIIILTLVFFWKILLTNLILSGVDVFLYFYPYKAYTAEALREGRLPLWNPHLFMGAPLLANSQVGLFYPLNWLFIWLDAPKQVAWSIGLHIALAGIFTVIFARQTLQLAWSASLIAAILFAFGGYLGAQVEHINQLQAAAWLPLLFLCYDFSLDQPRRWFWLLLLALLVALVLLAGHAQTAFISMFGLGLYALWRGIFEAEISWQEYRHPPYTRHLVDLTFRYLAFILSRLWPLIIASILAIALAAIQLLPTAELSGLSIRSAGLTFREAVSFSLRPTNLHYSLLPPFGLDLTQVFGQAFSEWVAYLGISGLALTLLGSLTALWQPASRRFIFVGVSGLILSMGIFTGPLYLSLYYLIPGFDLFRVPARWLLLYAFAAAILGGYGFDALIKQTDLRLRLLTIWHWLRARPWRLILPTIPALGLLALIIWKTPPLITLTGWLISTLATIFLLYLNLRPPPTPTSKHQSSSASPQSPISSLQSLISNLQSPISNLQSPVSSLQSLISNSQFSIALLLILELFLAAQTLNYNHPTAPQAYKSMRNSTAFLIATAPPDHLTPPGRFLSLSGTTYDPGDLADLQTLFSDRLSERALYDLIVTTKQKEVLFFNLPMVYGLHSVDGYDGGILPLTNFITLQELFLPTDDLSIDGRLREKLRFVPDSRLLSLLNTRWIITDKQFDVWIDGIFYDLQFPARLAPGQTINATDIPDFPPTALGLVSHLEGGLNLADDSPIAQVTLTFVDGRQENFILRAGQDTAEGNYDLLQNVAHRQAEIGVNWPYEATGVDYISLYPLTPATPIAELAVEALLPEGTFVLRGLSLIHQPTATSRSVILSTEGDYRQVHSGDVKVYENRDVQPRVFIVNQVETVPDDNAAIKRMKSPEFDPTTTIIHIAENGETPGLESRGSSTPQGSVEVIDYTPERVEIAVSLSGPGWVMLTDTYYPGWQATLDGQPVEIKRANIMFRSVAVPDGSHTLVFEFKPASLRTGLIISGLTLIIVAIGLVVGLAISKRILSTL